MKQDLLKKGCCLLLLTVIVTSGSAQSLIDSNPADQFDFKFKEGFNPADVIPIIPDPKALEKNLRRVKLANHDDLRPVTFERLAEAVLAEDRSVLCIVNRKEDCRILARLLPAKQTLHLSTNMCAAHRLRVLADIRKRLKPGFHHP